MVALRKVNNGCRYDRPFQKMPTISSTMSIILILIFCIPASTSWSGKHSNNHNVLSMEIPRDQQTHASSTSRSEPDFAHAHSTASLDKPFSTSDRFNTFSRRKNIAEGNLHFFDSFKQSHSLRDGEVITYTPGSAAPPFEVRTVDGFLTFPGKNTSMIIHVINPDSAFVESLWTSDGALRPLFSQAAQEGVQYLFISKHAEYDQKYGALWLKNRMLKIHEKSNPTHNFPTEVFNFAVQPLYKLANYLPVVFSQWQCVDHNCGLDQISVTYNATTFPVVLKRLDARYDWLPSPPSTFGNKTLPLVYAGNGCNSSDQVNKAIAIVMDPKNNCSYMDKMMNMQKSGAVALLIMVPENQTMQDMWCEGPGCSAVNMPASVVEYCSKILINNVTMKVTYQNTPSENFFMAIDRAGALAEVGWFLYPSMDFLLWQNQWFNYKYSLDSQLLPDRLTISVFENKVMQGSAGVQATVDMPALQELAQYSTVYLDMSLGCPGTRDTDCAHWDHTVNLYVCCDTSSPLCGMELGRWITPFRRRIGRWLSDVSPLLPLFTSQKCNFTMTTAAWAMPWVPSLKLHFQNKQTSGGIYPALAQVLYQPGATFDKNYNTHWKPYMFKVSQDVVKVVVYAVITGHGSDENGCGEFCVTSHHFQVNNVTNNITFDVAGTELGCADQVATGVEPNEHGTWLYGRDGWCDGRNVFPWVIDVTNQTQSQDITNILLYYGLFKGAAPNPKQNPGIMILYSYLVYYKKL